MHTVKLDTEPSENALRDMESTARDMARKGSGVRETMRAIYKSIVAEAIRNESKLPKRG
jgi:transposase-like protein